MKKYNNDPFSLQQKEMKRKFIRMKYIHHIMNMSLIIYIIILFFTISNFKF